MPGDSEHPVTLGDLRVVRRDVVPTPILENATIADLAPVLRAEGVVVIQKDADGDWPERIVETLADVISLGGIRSVLDALAEAQPFPPAGGVS